ncbi:MAG: hypothetical protein NVS3B20_15160 [Polyangiales bacterium]
MVAAEGGGGGNGVLIGVGVALLLGSAGGVLWWVSRKPPQPQQQTVVVVPSASTAVESTIELPAIDLPSDAGPETEPVETGVKAASGPIVVACPASCSGTPTEAIRQAVGARAGTAKQCYKTALEGNEGLAGEMSGD